MRTRRCSDDALAVRACAAGARGGRSQRAAGSGQSAARSAGAFATGSLNQIAIRPILGMNLGVWKQQCSYSGSIGATFQPGCIVIYGDQSRARFVLWNIFLLFFIAWVHFKHLLYLH